MYISQIIIYQLLLYQLLVSFDSVGYLLVNNKVDKNIWIRLNIFGSQVHIALYVINRLKNICNCLDLKYTFESLIQVAYYILDSLRDTCNSLNLSNIFHLMFLVD